MSAEDTPRLCLLVVDDEQPLCSSCAEVARRLGYEVFEANNAEAALFLVKHQKIDFMLLDLKLPLKAGTSDSEGGLFVLQTVKNYDARIAIMVMTAYATVISAVEAMRMGAEDVLTKPFTVDELVALLERTAARLHVDTESRRTRERLRSQRGAGPLIGKSSEMEKLYRILSKVTHSNHPVLILGEAGTGKELVARSIHFNSSQAARPFVPVDCSSLSPALLEAELFGYVKGALPAEARGGNPGPKEGLLASAAGGTVFLDEIAELPLELQAKLLRALQERTVRPLGASEPVPISGRILATSSRNLMGLVEQGKFRRDLFFRLNVVNLRIPPLRERKEDIVLLVDFFLERIESQTKEQHRLSNDTLRLLLLYDWPGNVRELETVVQRACEKSTGPVLLPADLPSPLDQLLDTPTPAPLPSGLPSSTAQDLPILSIASLEKRAILDTIRQLDGDKLKAARLLGIGKTTLYRKLKEYGIDQGPE